MTLTRLAVKIAPKEANLITLSDEKSETMIFKALKTGFIENKGQSGPLSVVGKTLKANASSQIIKFWPFFSCQLTQTFNT